MFYSSYRLLCLQIIACVNRFKLVLWPLNLWTTHMVLHVHFFTHPHKQLWTGEILTSILLRWFWLWRHNIVEKDYLKTFKQLLNCILVRILKRSFKSLLFTWIKTWFRFNSKIWIKFNPEKVILFASWRIKYRNVASIPSVHLNAFVKGFSNVF